MSSICLGMVADFDERAGDYPAAIATLEAAIATNESLLAGFTGSLQARLGWVLLHDGQLQRAETMYQRALESARRVRHTMVIFQAQAGMAALHRLHRRDDAAVDAATEALELYRAGGFRRFRNRIDPTADLRAAAAVSLRGARRDRRRPRPTGTGRDPARPGRRPAPRHRRRDPHRPATGRRPGPGRRVDRPRR